MTRASLAFRVLWRWMLAAIVIVLLLLVGLRMAASWREVQDLGDLPPQGGRLIETHEGAIYVLEKGDPDNTPVLFAHGTAAWSGLWLPTLVAVGDAEYHAIGYDLPPFGYSEHATDRDYSLQRQADRVLALVRTMDTPPIVVAHSFGAGPVVEAVLREPDVFGGLILVAGAIGLNTHLEPKQLPTLLRNDHIREFAVSATATNPYLTNRFLRGLIHIKDAADPGVISTLQQPMARSGYTNAVSDWAPTLLQTPTGALSTRPENWQNLTLQTVLIWGDKDTVTPLGQAETLLANTPASSLFVLSGVGHIPQIEAPEEFQKALMDALDALSQ